MAQPRCGNTDEPKKLDKNLRKRIPRRRRRQDTTKLTYRISKYPTKYESNKTYVDAQIKKAAEVWSKVAKIDFVPKTDEFVDVNIRFSSGVHDERKLYPFLSHSMDLHFDEDKDLTMNAGGKGVDIFQYAVHLIGHAIGLEHSRHKNAAMYPTYRYKPAFQLDNDDILAVRELYGERGPLVRFETSEQGEAAATVAPVEVANTVAPVEVAATVAPVEVAATVAPVEVVATVASVET